MRADCVISAPDVAGAGFARPSSRCGPKATKQLCFQSCEEALGHRLSVGAADQPIEGRTPAWMDRLPNAADTYLPGFVTCRPLEHLQLRSCPRVPTETKEDQCRHREPLAA